jgi:hypothetical protein
MIIQKKQINITISKGGSAAATICGARRGRTKGEEVDESRERYQNLIITIP